MHLLFDLIGTLDIFFTWESKARLYEELNSTGPAVTKRQKRNPYITANIVILQVSGVLIIIIFAQNKLFCGN